MVTKAIVLVPFRDRIEIECELSLVTAEKNGYAVIRHPRVDQPDVTRAIMISDALKMGFEEIIWIEPNISFTIGQLRTLSLLNKSVVSGMYATPGTDNLNGNIIHKEKDSNLWHMGCTGFGFLYTKAKVYQDIVDKLKLKKCAYSGKSFYPWFLPTVEKDLYFPPDLAFCQRIRQSDHIIYTRKDLCVDSIGSTRWKYSPEGQKAPYFINTPEELPGDLGDKQEIIDRVQATSLSQPFKRHYTKIIEIPRDKLAQGTSVSYNPSIVKHQGDIWMFYRHDAVGALHCATWQERRPISVRAVKLNEQMEPIVETDQPIDIPPQWGDVCMEDPKAASDGKHIHLCVIEPNFVEGYHSKWIVGVKYAKLTLKDGRFIVEEAFMPEFGENPGMEKNWSPFFHNGRVLLNYKMDPHIVFDPHNPKEFYETPGSRWAIGAIIHGGTPPIAVGNEYYSFMHGKYNHPQLIHKPTAYMMGCVAFETSPPFKVKKFTQYPLMWSDLGPDLKRPISCLFPAGAVFDDKTESWKVSYGHNDIACRIVTIPHANLLEAMKAR